MLFEGVHDFQASAVGNGGLSCIPVLPEVFAIASSSFARGAAAAPHIADYAEFHVLLHKIGKFLRHHFDEQVHQIIDFPGRTLPVLELNT